MANASSPSLSPLSLNQAHHFITIKLTNSNYLLWKTQVVPFLRGQSLYGFIDGSFSRPPATLPHSENSSRTIPNPAAEQWDKQEQLVQSLLISSLSESIIPLVVGQTSAAGIWNVLPSSLASTSHARILQLSIAMQNPQLSTETGEAYLNRFKGIADELTLAGRPLDDDSFNTFVFRGLPSEYDSIIDSLTTRGSSVPFSEPLGLIRSKDIMLGTHLSQLSLSSSISSHTANISRTSYGSYRPNSHPRPTYVPRPPSPDSGILPLPSLSPYPRPPMSIPTLAATAIFVRVLIIFVIAVHIVILGHSLLPFFPQWLITLPYHQVSILPVG